MAPIGFESSKVMQTNRGKYFRGRNPAVRFPPVGLPNEGDEHRGELRFQAGYYGPIFSTGLCL